MTDRDKTIEVMAITYYVAYCVEATKADPDLRFVAWDALDQRAKKSVIAGAKAALTAYESHLQASGMAVVAVAEIDALRHDLDRYITIASDLATEANASPYGKAVVKDDPTPSPSATELALSEAVGHISLLTAFWMETPGWTHAAEAAREFIGGVPIDWKAERPEASAEAQSAVANSNPVVQEMDDE